MAWPIKPSDKATHTDDDGFQYIYNLLENAWKRTVSQNTGGSGGTGGTSGTGTAGQTIIVGNQVTKLGVTASPSAPLQFDIPIPNNPTYGMMAPTVLKFTPGQNSVLQTITNFSAGGKSGFQADPNNQVVFDGTLHLQTVYQAPMTNGGALGTGTLYSAVIDKTLFKSVEKLEVV